MEMNILAKLYPMRPKGLGYVVLTQVLTKQLFPCPVSTAVSTTKMFSLFLSLSKTPKSRHINVQKT